MSYIQKHPRGAQGGGAPLVGQQPTSETPHTVNKRWMGVEETGNDPSAGSPTETLLRLLLPLNDKVWTASRGITAGEPAALPQSGGLTGSFNR